MTDASASVTTTRLRFLAFLSLNFTTGPGIARWIWVSLYYSLERKFVKALRSLGMDRTTRYRAILALEIVFTW